MRRLEAIAACAALAVAMVAAPPALPQQPYPTKPVRIIVPFAPGGGNDFIARVMGQRLAASFGHPFIVENRPGAGGLVGVEAGLRATPDGYTLTIIPSAYTSFPSMYKLNFDPVADIAPIVQISRYPLVMVTRASLPVRSIAELVALAKANPGKLNFASPGQGSTIHLATELFASMAGVKMNHVPYKGSGPALTDTLSGQTDLYLSSLPPALPHVRSGKLRAVAVTGPDRVPTVPEVPTVVESGLPGYQVTLWYGLAGPKRLPQPIVERVNAEVIAALKSKEITEQFETEGLVGAGGTPDDFLALIKKEIAVWRKVVSDAGVKPE